MLKRNHFKTNIFAWTLFIHDSHDLSNFDFHRTSLDRSWISNRIWFIAALKLFRKNFFSHRWVDFDVDRHDLFSLHREGGGQIFSGVHRVSWNLSLSCSFSLPLSPNALTHAHTRLSESSSFSHFLLNYLSVCVLLSTIFSTFGLCLSYRSWLAHLLSVYSVWPKMSLWRFF